MVFIPGKHGPQLQLTQLHMFQVPNLTKMMHPKKLDNHWTTPSQVSKSRTHQQHPHHPTNPELVEVLIYNPGTPSLRLLTVQLEKILPIGLHSIFPAVSES